jgi:hypothetical protein
MNSPVLKALSRRASLMALGATGLAALASPVTAEAKKKHGKNNGK